jgi:hypothetical protein
LTDNFDFFKRTFKKNLHLHKKCPQGFQIADALFAEQLIEQNVDKKLHVRIREQAKVADISENVLDVRAQVQIVANIAHNVRSSTYDKHKTRCDHHLRDVSRFRRFRILGVILSIN